MMISGTQGDRVKVMVKVTIQISNIAELLLNLNMSCG